MINLIKYSLIFFFLFYNINLFAQKKIKDEAMRYQQERMVFKQWDSKKFKPSTKVFGVEVNPLWYVTWALHPNYRKKDHRPLSATGPQTIRMGLVTQQRNVSQSYKEHSDTLRTTAQSELIYNSPNPADPMWLIYYSDELKPLMQDSHDSFLDGLDAETRQFLIDAKVWEDYISKFDELKERLLAGRSTLMERGNRILFYHDILLKYRALNERWQHLRTNVPKQLALIKKNKSIDGSLKNIAWDKLSDTERARQIVRDLQYLN